MPSYCYCYYICHPCYYLSQAGLLGSWIFFTFNFDTLKRPGSRSAASRGWGEVARAVGSFEWEVHFWVISSLFSVNSCGPTVLMLQGGALHY